MGLFSLTVGHLDMKKKDSTKRADRLAIYLNNLTSIVRKK